MRGANWGKILTNVKDIRVYFDGAMANKVKSQTVKLTHKDGSSTVKSTINFDKVWVGCGESLKLIK